MRCCHCGAIGTLTFCARWVDRGAVLPGKRGGTVFQRPLVPLARCSACKRSARVLPAELLPRKTYSLPVIENAAGRYVSPDPGGPGLRKVVKGLGEHAPCPSTLHRWLAGLGELAFDRLPKPSRPETSDSAPPAPTTATVVEESTRRVDPGLRAVWQQSFFIPSGKYQSEKRRDQLEGCARILCAAQHLFPDASAPLTVWRRELIGWLGVAAWDFPTGFSCTPSQLTPQRTPEVGSPARSKPRPLEAHHGPRPPPHGRLSL